MRGRSAAVYRAASYCANPLGSNSGAVIVRYEMLEVAVGEEASRKKTETCLDQRGWIWNAGARDVATSQTRDLSRAATPDRREPSTQGRKSVDAICSGGVCARRWRGHAGCPARWLGSRPFASAARFPRRCPVLSTTTSSTSGTGFHRATFQNRRRDRMIRA
jgi:hypothetical protein